MKRPVILICILIEIEKMSSRISQARDAVHAILIVQENGGVWLNNNTVMLHINDNSEPLRALSCKTLSKANLPC